MSAEMRIAEKIKSWSEVMDRDGYFNKDLVKNESCFTFRLTASGMDCRIYVESDEDKEWISVFVYPSLTVLDARREAFMPLLNEINNQVSIGRIAMNERGVLQLKVVVDVEQVEVTDKLIDNHVEALMAIVHRWIARLSVFNYSNRSLKEVSDFINPDEGIDLPDAKEGENRAPASERLQ